MSNTDTDSFIKEVSEEVRHDRMFKLWKKYAPFVLGAIVLVVGASAAWNWMKHRDAMAARERGAAFIAAADSSGQIEILAGTMEGNAGTLADLRLAAALAQGEERAAAAEIYRKVAAGTDRPAYRDLALLRAIQIEAARGDPAALIGELGPLVTEGRPYRPLALELRGVLRVNAGNLDGARADLEAALADEAATLDTRRRVGEILNALTPGALAPASGGQEAGSGDTAEEPAEESAEEPAGDPAAENDEAGTGDAAADDPAEESEGGEPEAGAASESPAPAAEDDASGAVDAPESESQETGAAAEDGSDGDADTGADTNTETNSETGNTAENIAGSNG